MIFCGIVRLIAGEVDYKEIGDCVHVSGYSSTDLCLPALDYLRKCSQVGTLPFTLGITLKSLLMRDMRMLLQQICLKHVSRRDPTTLSSQHRPHE